MTLEKTIRKLLESHGMYPDTANDVIERAKVAPMMEPFRNHWGAEGLSEGAVSVAWVSVRYIALEYIDETCPDAWFRREFVD